MDGAFNCAHINAPLEIQQPFSGSASASAPPSVMTTQCEAADVAGEQSMSQVDLAGEDAFRMHNNAQDNPPWVEQI
jgi:hypothetical protein